MAQLPNRLWIDFALLVALVLLGGLFLSVFTVFLKREYSCVPYQKPPAMALPSSS